MKIEVRFINIPVSDHVKDVVTRHALLSLTRFAPRVHRVTVRLEDVNGPDGGCDKICSVSITGAFTERFVSTRGTNLLETSARAFDSARRAVTRAIIQQRNVVKLTRDVRRQKLRAMLA